MPADRPLKIVDLDRFFASQGVRLGCQVCGNGGFHIHNETLANSRTTLIALKLPDTDIVGADCLEVVMLACNRCAAVQLFARAPIVAWADQNPSN